MADDVKTAKRETSTADDTLKQKSRDPNVVSGGHLVAKALKNEGVDTIFTLCGGHIIDIYDGCVDEGIRIIDVRHEQVAAHAADGYARQTGKLGCVVTTAGPGCTNAMTGIATAFRSESPVLHIGGQGALTQHMMGSLQDLPHVDIMRPVTKFAAGVRSTERIADMISMAARECFTGALGPRLSRDPARRARPRDRVRQGGAARSPATTAPRPRSVGDPADIEKLADILVKAERPGDPARAVRCGRARGHEAAIALRARARHPGLFQRRRRAACCRRATRIISTARAPMPSTRPTSSSSSARPFDFRMGYGQRLGRDAQVVQIDWTTAPSARTATSRWASSAIPARSSAPCCQAATGRIDKGDKRQAQGMDAGAGAAEEAATAKLMPLFTSNSTPIHPYRVA